jgi:acyl carrier protein
MTMNFLDLFNAVAEVARPIYTKYTPVPDKDSLITDFGMDSLDMMMVCVFMCELFGVPEEVGKEMHATTVQEMEDFLMSHKTQQPDSIEAAVEYCK